MMRGISVRAARAGMFFKPLEAMDKPARCEAAKLLLCACLLVSGAVQAVAPIPPSKKVALGQTEPFCKGGAPQEWRKAGTLEGVSYQESRVCDPDNPTDIAAFVKGTNNISMETLMATNLALDAITMSDDMNGDGDPDRIVIKLEIMEINTTAFRKIRWRG